MNQTRVSPMPDFLTLTCPTCGAKLKLNEKIHLLVCASCGNEHMVHRDGGSIYLAPIAQDVRQIRVGVDKTAAELAVVRLTKELQELDGVMAETKQLSLAEFAKRPPIMSFLSLAMVTSIVIIIVGASSRSEGLAAFATIALIGLIIWNDRVNRSHKQEGERVRDAELDRLQAQYNVMRAALDKNKRVAES